MTWQDVIALLNPYARPPRVIDGDEIPRDQLRVRYHDAPARLFVTRRRLLVTDPGGATLLVEAPLRALTGFRIDLGPTLCVGYRDENGTLQELRLVAWRTRARVDESEAAFDRWIAAIKDLRMEEGLG